MSEILSTDPEPLPSAGGFFALKRINTQEAGADASSQRAIRSIVADVKALTEGRNQRINRTFENYRTEVRTETTTEIADIALVSYGLFNGHRYSRETLRGLPEDNRAAEIAISGSVFNIEDASTTKVERHYGIIKNLGGKSLEIVQKTRYKEGPDYFVPLSKEEIQDLGTRIQALKPTPTQSLQAAD